MDINPIRQWRNDHNVKLVELADRVGTSSANLCRIEKNKQQISEYLLPKLQAETGIPAEKLRPDLAAYFTKRGHGPT